MAWPLSRTRKYPPFDRLLFFSPPFSFGCFCTGRDSSLRPPASSSTNASLVLPPNGAHRSLKPLFAVIARNHTRGHYENDSADAYFFSLFLLPVRSLSRPFSPLVTRFRLAPRPYDTLLRFGNVSGHEVRDSPGMPILFNVFISESGEQFASGKLFRQLPLFFFVDTLRKRGMLFIHGRVEWFSLGRNMDISFLRK